MTLQTMTRPDQDQSLEKTIQQLRVVYRDAPRWRRWHWRTPSQR